jgi:hypothetical protein
MPCAHNFDSAKPLASICQQNCFASRVEDALYWLTFSSPRKPGIAPLTSLFNGADSEFLRIGVFRRALSIGKLTLVAFNTYGRSQDSLNRAKRELSSFANVSDASLQALAAAAATAKPK